ncbi:MAG TPA: glycoside hydrolase family 28 protein [Puia sp.]|nr:glycoside hydrolase family 28 protein [Puia sp.]
MKSLFICSFFLTSLGHAIAQPSRERLPVIARPHFRSDTFNILKYGAVGDGITLDTKAINAAIDACSKKGGGVVLVPGGLWLTGPLVMKNNVNLSIRADALLLFTRDFDQYPLVKSYYAGLPSVRCQSPISGDSLTNVAITGAGVIDGSGDAWRPTLKKKLNESEWRKLVASGGVVSDVPGRSVTWYPSENAKKGSEILTDSGTIREGVTFPGYEAIKDFQRPALLVFLNCKKVLLEGVTFKNSPSWNLHLLLCQDITIDKIHAKNPPYGQNTDAVDLESCTRALVQNSTFEGGDDGITLKSGRDEAGRKRNVPTRDVIIRDCITYNVGSGVAIGSEMSGGVRNIFISHCSFVGSSLGIKLKTKRGRGGVVEKIYASDINMSDIQEYALVFDMFYGVLGAPKIGDEKPDPRMDPQPVTEATPVFRDIHFRHIYCNGAEQAIFVRGLPEMPVRDVYLEDMVFKTKKGMECMEARGIHLKNIRFLPAKTDPVIGLRDAKDITLDNLATSPNTVLFLDIRGKESGNISVTHTDLSTARDRVKLAPDVSPAALRLQ